MIYLFLIILVMPKPHNIRKNLKISNVINKDSSNNANEQFKRNLNDDNYMILYFNQDCSYPNGFVKTNKLLSSSLFDNVYRNDVDFITIGNNYKKYTKNESFNVIKGIGIEIHFNKAIKKLTSFFDAFYDINMKYLSFVDLSNFDTSQVIDMNSMLYGCSSLKSLDLSNFDTSQVTDMGWMFYNCSSLESLDLSNFDTSQVSDMNSMFYNCNSLKSLDLSN